MKILTGGISGPKAFPSPLYRTDLQAFSFVLKTPTNQPITYNKSDFFNNSNIVDQTFEDSTPTIRTSSLVGQFLLSVSTCFSDTDGSYEVFSPFSYMWRALGSTEQKVSVGFLKDANPSTQYTSTHSHTVAVGEPHDHLSTILAYHSTETILYDELAGLSTFNSRVNVDSDRVILTLPTDQVQGDLLVVGIMHRFPLDDIDGWTIDFSEKIGSINELNPPYYKDQRLTLISRVVPVSPIPSLIIDVVNSTGVNTSYARPSTDAGEDFMEAGEAAAEAGNIF